MKILNVYQSLLWKNYRIGTFLNIFWLGWKSKNKIGLETINLNFYFALLWNVQQLFFLRIQHNIKNYQNLLMFFRIQTFVSGNPNFILLQKCDQFKQISISKIFQFCSHKISFSVKRASINQMFCWNNFDVFFQFFFQVYLQKLIFFAKIYLIQSELNSCKTQLTSGTILHVHFGKNSRVNSLLLLKTL